MATKNNIFMTAGEPVMRYQLTVQHGVTALRLNPDDNQKKIECSLEPTPEPPFEYERDVLELYTEKEVKFFKQANKYLFQTGMLKEYEGEPEPIDTTNMLTDADIMALASERSVKRIEAELKKLTSRVSVQRVYDTAVEIGRPAKTLAIMKERLNELT